MPPSMHTSLAKSNRRPYKPVGHDSACRRKNTGLTKDQNGTSEAVTV